MKKLILLVVLVGCAPPSMLTSIQSVPTTTPTTFSDYGVIVYAESVKSEWVSKGNLDQSLLLGGALSLAGMSTAALSIANAPQTKGFLVGANAIMLLLGIIKPGDRDSAYAAGTGLLLDAEGSYVVALTTAGYCSIPTDRITPAGALLLQQTNAAVKVTQNLILATLPSLADLTTLAARIGGPTPTAMRAASEPCK